MTLLDDAIVPPPEPPSQVARSGERPQPQPSGWLKWLTSTDHKVIGLSYIVTSFAFFTGTGVLRVRRPVSVFHAHSWFLDDVWRRATTKIILAHAALYWTWIGLRRVAGLRLSL